MDENAPDQAPAPEALAPGTPEHDAAQRAWENERRREAAEAGRGD